MGRRHPRRELRRKDIREFLDWVYEQAVKDEGENPGRTANKAREHLRAILYWAWEQELIEVAARGGHSECPCCRRRFADAG